MIRAMKSRVRDSMGLKFISALIVVMVVLMVLGTLFVVRAMQEKQYRTLELRSREMGLFLGRASTDALLAKDMITLDSLVQEFVQSKDMVYAYIADNKGMPLTSTVAAIKKSYPAAKAVLASRGVESAPAFADALKTVSDILEVSTDIMLGSDRLGTVTMGMATDEIRQDARKVTWLLLGTALGIVVVMSTIVYIMAQKMVVGPTGDVAAVVSDLAGGDLTKSVPVRSNDELGTLGRGINSMIVSLKAMLVNVQAAAASVGSASAQVKSISEKMAAGSREQSEAVEESASSVNEMHFALKEIAANVEDLTTTSEHTSSSILEMAASVDEVARTMSQLSTSIEDTTSAITQMSASIQQIAENVESLSAAAEQTSASATQISASVREVETNAQQSAALAEAVAADAQQLGMQSIEKTIEGMGRIQGAARRTAEVVARLQERSESIGSILTVIEDITDQTALLALNASILAAQAGEHGKGFGVVATEIRELANRTASSTQEIGKLITAVQGETKEAVDAMGASAGLVDEGVRLSRDAGDALRKILERAGLSRDMSRSISKAAVEQARGVKQVSDAVGRINEMTHQIARATSEQKSGSEQIMRASEKMREITRFVKSATIEQVKGSKDITAAVDQMNTKIGMVNRATGEVKSGSDLIVKAIERIKAIRQQNSEMAESLETTVETMAAQAESLNKGVEKFRTA